MKPAIGRIVHYVQSTEDGKWKGTNGTRVHPAIITRVWSETCVNLTVFLDADGLDTRSSVLLLPDLGEGVHNPNAGWRWPEREIVGPPIDDGSLNQAIREINATIGGVPFEISDPVTRHLQSDIPREEIEVRIHSVAYEPIGAGVLQCVITLDNGTEVYGHNGRGGFRVQSHAAAERASYEDAFNRLWPRFQFLAVEERFRRRDLAAAKPEPEDDAAFIARSGSDSMDGRALDPSEMERLYRLAGYTGDLPPYRIAYPSIWEMIIDAKHRLAVAV